MGLCSPPTLITPLLFRSPGLGTSANVYSFVFRPELLSLSVIPMTSNCSGLCLSRNVIGTPIAPSQSIGISAALSTLIAS